MDGCGARGRSRSPLRGGRSLRGALATNNGVKATDLNVDTRNSVVTLTGQVATQAEK